jgi:hypothetical protein
MFIGDDSDYKRIQEMKKEGKYVFATCYDIDWGFLIPCESGVIFEQQTDGVCCHHIYMEGILIPLRKPCSITGKGETLKVDCDLLDHLVEANYSGSYLGRSAGQIWMDICEASHIDFEFISPRNLPRNQEGFQWILYHGHEEGHGNSFCLEPYKDKPIVLIYPNCD